jgi:uncharacterized protein DUF6946
MRIEKNGHPIRTPDEWRKAAPPKRPNQWAAGHSACELARAWCGDRQPQMPQALRTLLDSRAETRGLSVDTVTPEHPIRFDAHRGEPRNADLAFLGKAGKVRVAVTIEAKADEPFGSRVAETLAAALERAIENPRSNGVRRVEALVRALFRSGQNGDPPASTLRYQLLTAVAGTLAYAAEQRAPTAVLVVHEFVTNKTSATRHAKNAADYRAFLHRLGGRDLKDQGAQSLLGPFHVPGAPLFSKPATLWIGKVVTQCP